MLCTVSEGVTGSLTKGNSMGGQSSPLLTVANLEYLLSGLARTVTVGGIVWRRHRRLETAHEGLVQVDAAVKHRASPGGGDEAVYEPDDIPEVPLQPRVAPGTYRAILEAFAAECKVVIGADFAWTEPGDGER